MKQVLKHLAIISAISIAFVTSGFIAQFCESFHTSLEIGAAIFSVSFASISAGLYKLYQLFTVYFIG